MAAQSQYTIEDILSAPFAGNLVASPSTDAFAWVGYEEGARNVWVAEGPAFAGRKLTTWTEDDGQAITNLSFLPDGSGVVFVRGGAPNRAGEIPNPASEPQEVRRSIFVADLDGTLRELATGSSPVTSPQAGAVAFLNRGGIWKGDTKTSDSGEALLEIRGGPGSLTWSPKADQLAFTSSRGDHTFVGVYDPDSDGIRYLDPSLDHDRFPTWSPDGGRIAFIRVPNNRSRLPFAPARSDLPWSIRVVDLATGDGTTIWTADEGPGSAFYQGVVGPPLIWLESGELVFPWEKDGWLHLYAVPATGGEASLLTPGDFEVEDVVRGPEGRYVYYSSNQDDIDRRHVWRVRPGDAAEQLSEGTSIEWNPAVSGMGTLAYLTSSAVLPAHAAVHGEEGPTAMTNPVYPPSFPASSLVEPEQVVFEAEDGIRIHGQLFLPPGENAASGSARPAVLFFHGGSRRQMLLGWHYRGYYHNAYGLNQYLASRGYVVLSVNYRSGTGYGMEFREALDYGARGASEYRDVVAAAAFLSARDDVDGDRIGLWGGSYGGYLTALGLARNSDLFAAGVDIHGVHDWNVVIRNFVPSYQAEAREAFAKLAFESSPMASIDDWRSPVLLIHGDDDRNVPFSESVDLIEDLRRRSVTVEQLVFPDEVHGFLLHRNWVAAYEHAADFLDRRLMKLGSGS